VHLNNLKAPSSMCYNYVHVLTVRVGNITRGVSRDWDTPQDRTSLSVHTKRSPVSSRNNSDPILRSNYDNTARNNTRMPTQTVPTTPSTACTQTEVRHQLTL